MLRGVRQTTGLHSARRHASASVRPLTPHVLAPCNQSIVGIRLHAASRGARPQRLQRLVGICCTQIPNPPRPLRLCCDHRNGNETSKQSSGAASNGTDPNLLPQVCTRTHTAAHATLSDPSTQLSEEGSPASIGLEELGQMCGVKEFPPEVEPLADCFKRASAKVDEASNIREALEAEVRRGSSLVSTEQHTWHATPTLSGTRGRAACSAGA